MSRQCGEGDINCKKRHPLHVAGGCVVSLQAILILQGEKDFIVNYLIPYHMEWLQILIRCLFDAGTAAAVFFIFRYFLSVKSHKLIIYYLLSVVLSVAAAVLAGGLIIRFLKDWFIETAASGFLDTKSGIFIMTNLSGVFVLLLVAVFSGAFAFLTKRKVNYIQYISREIKNIENDGFGRELKVSGNDEIADLCSSINHMSQKLLEKQENERRLEKRKNELIVNVSHDLRSPLTSIIGYVKLLKKEGASDEEKFREYIDVVDVRLQGLNEMVNELFELTRLNGTDVEMNLEKTDMAALLRHLAYENEILLQEHGLALQNNVTDFSFEMKVDINKIVRAFQNLFDNARKYAKEGSEVILSAGLEENIFLIQMKNQIKNQETLQAEKLFDRFYQGDASRSDTRSSGLGLAIVKRIVELHGGEITADVKEGWLVLEVRFWE